MTGQDRRGDFGVAGAVFAVSLAAMLVRLLVPTPIGMADNADGRRVLCHLGVTLDWPIRDYVKFHYPPGPGCEYHYATSQLWIDRLAQELGSALFGHAGFHLLDLALVSCVVASLCLAVSAVTVPGPRWRGLAVAAGAWVVVADSAFFGYFASVFTEGAAFLGILAVVGGLLLLPGCRWPLGAAFVLVGAVVAANAKTQTLVLLAGLAAALWIARRSAMPLLVVATVATLAVQGSTLAKPSHEAVGGPAFLREVNAYNAIFQGIVDGAHDTEGDLAALGLPPSFARYAGRHWWDPGTARTDPEYASYRDRITLTNVGRYYVTHPVRTTQLLHVHARHVLTARVDYLGSYGQDSGQPPRAHEHRVPLVSSAARLMAPLGLFAVVPLWVLLGWLGVRAARSLEGRALGGAVLFLVGSAVLLFAGAALADGHEGVKHQAVTLFCTALAVPFAAATLGQRKSISRTGPDSLGARSRSPFMTMNSARPSSS